MARSVPEYRQVMIESVRWLALTRLGWPKEMLANRDYSEDALSWQEHKLSSATLYWVSPDMCELLQHAWPKLPMTRMDPAMLPSESGLVMFARPLVGTDTRSGEAIEYNAMLWGDSEVSVHYAGPTKMGVESMAYSGHATSISMWAKWEKWYPLGRTDWPHGTETTGLFVPDGCTFEQYGSIVEDRLLLAAFCLLSQQQNIVTTTEARPDNHARKRLARKKIVAANVHLVDIKHRPSKPTPGGGRQVDWSHRWWVKGHWRTYHVGPGRKEERPVYIQPFIKGPDDKPLAPPSETVRVWKD